MSSSLSPFPTVPLSKWAGVGRKLRGTEPEELTPAANGIFHTIECHISIKSFHLSSPKHIVLFARAKKENHLQSFKSSTQPGQWPLGRSWIANKITGS